MSELTEDAPAPKRSRGRPAKAKAKPSTSQPAKAAKPKPEPAPEVTEEKRPRPPEDSGPFADKSDSLDQMEQRAALRVKEGGRVPLSSQLKLEWNDIEEGFNYQWASDAERYPVKLQQMVDAGYMFVRYKHGTFKGEKVVKTSGSCKLYLMRCPEEYHIADMEKKHEKSVRQYREVMQVPDNLMAENSTTRGEGKAGKLSLEDNPDVLSLIEGE